MSRRLTTEATARPTSRPVRATTSGEASAGGRPVTAAMAVPDASASRHPRAPHAHRRPSGSTITWPTWPALPDGPVEQPPVEDDAAADAGGDHHGEEVAHRPAAPDPAFGQGEGLGVVVERDGEPGELRQPVAQGEVPPRRDVERRHRPRAEVHGPTAPDPAHDHGGTGSCRPPVREPSTCPTRLASAAKSSSASSVRGVGTRRGTSSSPVGRDEPGGDLGPADVDGQADARTCYCPAAAATAPSDAGRPRC